jgi:hypothetical protein
MLIYKMLKYQQTPHSEEFNRLKRVFNEQYKIVSKKKKVNLRPKQEISSSSLQSPHDPDCTYRNKGGQKVKGYSANLTETCSDEGLNLITNVMVESANTSDTTFVEKAIKDTKEITDQPIETAYMDGGYQTPDNDDISKGIDMVYTGIQGAISRYDLELKPDGLWVTDSQTGEKVLAKEVKKQKNSTEDRYQIKTPEGKYRYFGPTEIRASELRRQIKQRPLAQTQKRNNVEATIYHFGCELKKQKTKYRGLIKQKIWSFCRCLWINILRINKYFKHPDRKTNKKVNNQAILQFFMLTSFMINLVAQKLLNFTSFPDRIFNRSNSTARLRYCGVM